MAGAEPSLGGILNIRVCQRTVLATYLMLNYLGTYRRDGVEVDRHLETKEDTQFHADQLGRPVAGMGC
jgi:hypothetical protein